MGTKEGRFFTFIKVVSHPLGNHEHNHNGETVGEIAGCLDKDDREGYGHPNHPA